jgi:hypothetical protein
MFQDTYFYNDNSIEGYYCAHVFSGMTSKILLIAGMKTEFEFTDLYLDFIRQHGIPSAPQHVIAKSEMSQHVREIKKYLVITDQLTGLHSPWQNPAEPYGVENLMSNGQVLLDKTGASDSMWFFTHIRNRYS